MSTNPVSGAGYFLRGLQLINQPGVKRYVIIPFLINIVIFTLLFGLLSGYFGDFIDSIMPNLPDWLAWLTWLIWLLFAISAGIILFFGFTIVANLVGAPFNGYLAAAVEKKITGQAPADSGRSFPQEAIFAVVNELGKLLYYVAWAIPLLILTIIPVVNLIAPVLWLLFGMWMLVLEYGDYPMSNHGLSFKQVRSKLAEKRFLALGFGGAVMLGTMIPLFNFLVMPVAVAGATVMRVEQYELSDSTPT